MHSEKGTTHGAIAQLVEQRTENPCVPGSIPGDTTRTKPKGYRNVAQLVAHYVRDVGVGRSSRLFPTSKSGSPLWWSALFVTLVASRPSFNAAFGCQFDSLIRREENTFDMPICFYLIIEWEMTDVYALKGQPAPSPGQSEAAPWVMEIHRRLSP